MKCGSGQHKLKVCGTKERYIIIRNGITAPSPKKNEINQVKMSRYYRNDILFIRIDINNATKENQMMQTLCMHVINNLLN